MPPATNSHPMACVNLSTAATDSYAKSTGACRERLRAAFVDCATLPDRRLRFHIGAHNRAIKERTPRQLPVGVCSGGKQLPLRRGSFHSIRPRPATELNRALLGLNLSHRHQSKMECVCSDGSH